MTINLGLTQKHVGLQERVREFVTRHLPSPWAREVDEAGRFPVELWAEADFRDLLGLAVPADCGGAGGGLCELVIVCEELARGAAALAVAYGLSAVAGGWALARFGSSAHHKSMLRQYVRGQARFTLAPSEIENGDPLATAEGSEDGGYCIRARELTVPGALVADQILVVARTDATPPGTGGLGLFYVSPREHGITTTPVPQMGQRALPACEVDLDGVRVSSAALLVELPHGWEVRRQVAAAARLLLAAASTGLAVAAFENTLAHARAPRPGRQPLGNSQATQHALAALHTRIEAARLLAYHGAWHADAGEDYSADAAVASEYATAAVGGAVATGARIFGPAANRLDRDMQRYLRDAMPLAAAGNPDGAKDLIAHSLGL